MLPNLSTHMFEYNISLNVAVSHVSRFKKMHGWTPNDHIVQIFGPNS
jgi:hypothetical protein